MSNGFGKSSKNQTVYGGPTIQTSEGTVYNGPVGGTVYQGSAPAASVAYNPSLQALRSVRGPNVGARKGAGIFYLIAAVTAVRTFLLFIGVLQLTPGANRLFATDLQSVMMVNGVAIAIFVALGIFTSRGSKMALIIGMLLYVGDTALLLMGDLSSNAVYIAAHGLFLYYLLRAYRQFTD